MYVCYHMSESVGFGKEIFFRNSEFSAPHLDISIPFLYS